MGEAQLIRQAYCDAGICQMCPHFDPLCSSEGCRIFVEECEASAVEEE